MRLSLSSIFAPVGGPSAANLYRSHLQVYDEIEEYISEIEIQHDISTTYSYHPNIYSQSTVRCNAESNIFPAEQSNAEPTDLWVNARIGVVMKEIEREQQSQLLSRAPKVSRQTSSTSTDTIGQASAAFSTAAPTEETAANRPPIQATPEEVGSFVKDGSGMLYHSSLIENLSQRNPGLFNPKKQIPAAKNATIDQNTPPRGLPEGSNTLWHRSLLENLPKRPGRSGVYRYQNPRLVSSSEVRLEKANSGGPIAQKVAGRQMLGPLVPQSQGGANSAPQQPRAYAPTSIPTFSFKSLRAPPPHFPRRFNSTRSPPYSKSFPATRNASVVASLLYGQPSCTPTILDILSEELWKKPFRVSEVARVGEVNCPIVAHVQQPFATDSVISEPSPELDIAEIQAIEGSEEMERDEVKDDLPPVVEGKESREDGYLPTPPISPGTEDEDYAPGVLEESFQEFTAGVVRHRSNTHTSMNSDSGVGSGDSECAGEALVKLYPGAMPLDFSIGSLKGNPGELYDEDEGYSAGDGDLVVNQLLVGPYDDFHGGDDIYRNDETPFADHRDTPDPPVEASVTDSQHLIKIEQESEGLYPQEVISEVSEDRVPETSTQDSLDFETIQTPEQEMNSQLNFEHFADAVDKMEVPRNPINEIVLPEVPEAKECDQSSSNLAPPEELQQLEHSVEPPAAEPVPIQELPTSTKQVFEEEMTEGYKKPPRVHHPIFANHQPSENQGDIYDACYFRASLNKFVKDQCLEKFYCHDHPSIIRTADKAAELVANGGDPVCISALAKIAQYETVVLCDDSGSMVTGKRISALKEALIRLTDIITTFDTPGISVRWLNTPNNKEIMNNIKTVAGLNAVLNEVKYRGVTPLGEALDKKIIRPFVKAKTVRNKKFEKPVLVSIITDGEPDDAKDLIENIREMKWFLSRNGFKDSTVAFQICQVGDSLAANLFLDELAQNNDVGRHIYCTSAHIPEDPQYFSSPEEYNKWWAKELLIAIEPCMSC